MKKMRVALLLLIAAIVIGICGFPEQVLRMEYARQRVLAGAVVREKTVAGEHWHYLEAGTGPLIVLVHGYTGSKENWLPLMKSLARGYRVIAVDLPGWGESSPHVNADYGPSAQAARLHAFLQSEHRPVALLVGHSMGGMISGLLAAEHPQQVERIVFMASAGVRFHENDFTRRVQQGDNPFAVYEVRHFRNFLQEFVFAKAPYVPRPVLGAILKQRKARREFEQQVFTQMGSGPEAFLLQQRLAEIQQPAGLLWCDGDRIIDPSATQVFAKGLKTSQIHMLHGCGHMPMMEQPEAVAAFLRSRF